MMMRWNSLLGGCAARGRRVAQSLALVAFGVYGVLFPGSTVAVALDRVPDWGVAMGGALLLLQGVSVGCWLVGGFGRRGALAALLLFLMAWGVEHIGVTMGVPFGRYRYTAVLQPALFGQVPLAIPCAWLMVGIGAWQLAGSGVRAVPLAATLVLLLDMQIETMATQMNRYWVWIDHGPYYGVPTANFVAWWLVGGMLVSSVALLLRADVWRADWQPAPQGVVALMAQCQPRIPAALYLFSTAMFTIVNLARGFTIAGVIGCGVLGVVVAYQVVRLRRRSSLAD